MRRGDPAAELETKDETLQDLPDYAEPDTGFELPGTGRPGLL